MSQKCGCLTAMSLSHWWKPLWFAVESTSHISSWFRKSIWPSTDFQLEISEHVRNFWWFSARPFWWSSFSHSPVLHHGTLRSSVRHSFWRKTFCNWICSSIGRMEAGKRSNNGVGRWKRLVLRPPWTWKCSWYAMNAHYNVDALASCTNGRLLQRSNTNM